MSRKIIIMLVFCVLAGPGCNIIYKQNIQQGNAIEQDKLDQLKLGMTMNQVAFLMGTPAVRDPFHQSRWDYYYWFSIRGGEPITRLVTLEFTNAVLTAIHGVDFDDEVTDVVTGSGDSVDAPEDQVNTLETEALSTEIESAEPSTAGSGANDAGESVEPVVEAPDTTTLDAQLGTSGQAGGDTPGNAAGLATEEAVEMATEGLAADATEETPPFTAEAGPVAGKTSEGWTIQLGVFDVLRNARNFQKEVRDAGFQAEINTLEVSEGQLRYVLRSESFESKNQAQRQLDMINSTLQTDAFLVPPEG